MGARVYLPTLGRFLQVDLVDQGTANFYVYANDPVNQSDYSGEFLNCGNSQSLSSFFRCITGGDRGSAQTGAKVKERAKYEYKEFKENIVHKPVKKIEETVNTASDWWSTRSTEVSVGVASITPVGPVGFNGGLIFDPDGGNHWSFSLGSANPGVDISIMKSLKEGNTESGCGPTTSVSMVAVASTDYESLVSAIGVSFPFRPGYFAGYECIW